jgi:hypothetical protein
MYHLVDFQIWWGFVGKKIWEGTRTERLIVIERGGERGEVGAMQLMMLLLSCAVVLIDMLSFFFFFIQ